MHIERTGLPSAPLTGFSKPPQQNPGEEAPDAPGDSYDSTAAKFHKETSYTSLAIPGEKPIFCARDEVSMALGTSSRHACSMVPPPFATTLGSLDILYTNDIHGAITPKPDEKNPGNTEGGVAYLGGLIRKREEESGGNFVLLDGGDWGQGSYESKLTRGKTLIDVMNSLRYDAAEIGNHEFDWGRKALSEMMSRASFPILGANIIEDGDIISGAKPYTIKDVNGLKVGIIGLITPETPGTVDPRNIEGLTFNDTASTVKKLLPELKKEGAELFIVLSHEGDAADEKLAKAVPEIDVIVGGHSHTALAEPKKVGNTLIVQSGTGGVALGSLSLSLDDESGEILSFKNVLIPVSSKDIKPDADVERIIAPVVKEAQETMGVPVGNTDVDLTHDRKKVFETVMGNVVCDAIRESTGADIAMQNSGAIRDQIMKGDINFGDLYRVMPFDKYMVTIELTGTQIKEIMENSSARKKGNMQVSGLTMDIDPRKKTGSKVSNIRVNGAALDEGKTYRVTVDDFLAAGANGYGTFLAGKNAAYNGLCIDAFKAYMEKHSPLTEESARIEGRLNFLVPPRETK
ncbi:MAG: bifunctional UDP-sugar hydrolase/5'-nucleotidase [Candidatus Eremiobacteraeota bacterium]|nr:bifunctional UDP-sugar hydrolase/5'-nucleotidase [Candidatus Eremiobacteraeota bacterium]